MTKRNLALVLFLGCLTCAGAGWDPPVELQAQHRNAASAIGQHLIVTTQGQVSVKRNGWNNYAPAMFGMSLQRGDLLRLEGSSQAKIVCAGLTVYDAPVGISGLPCPPSSPLLSHHGSPIQTTRQSLESASFPIVLSPRRTKLLTLRPKLRWTPINEAAKYTIVLRGSGLNWQAVVRSTTEISYPERAPSLRPGDTYKLIVSANDLRSDDEGGFGMGFTVLLWLPQKKKK